ncbi:RNA polymerase sigma factor [Actinomadura fibrosa]|uniref:RNA polymerase sigma factor n=1 Tax=Actinomadura fibrosa TaxID=111802 RepID=A0ABW2Y0T8_9ACTN|nr:RNA polymerase sigma factor [Actinomadura fibrosa]
MSSLPAGRAKDSALNASNATSASPSVPSPRVPSPRGEAPPHAPAPRAAASRGTSSPRDVVDPMKDYLSRIGRRALLTAEQEVDLAKRIEAGLFARERLEEQGPWLSAQDREDLAWIAADGQRAKEHMVEANLRLVVSLAKRYMGHGLPLNDLVQEGNLGLIRAVEKFEYRRGLKFSTYAVWWIKQAISRALADQSRTIRIPVHVVEVLNRMTRLRRSMAQELGREPTSAELAAELDVTPEKVEWLRRQAREPLSLHTPLGEDGDGELGDVIEDPDGGDPADVVASSMLRGRLDAVLETLTEREAGVISMRFGLSGGGPKTLEEVGKVYGVTRERIRQIESKGMHKLRHPSRRETLADLLS